MFWSYALAAAIGVQADSGSEVTIYNQGFALVKEVRNLDLKQGRQDVRIEDVAQLIEPSSVGIRSLSAPGSFEVLEQNYQYDLISTQAILNKAVGHKIALNRVLPNGTKERIVGTLLSSPTAIVGGQGGSQYVYNGMVIQADDGRILLDPSGEIEVSSIPEGLISKPSLLWDLISDRAGQNKVEISYLTQGMSWSADYVLTLDGEGKKGDLKGWVTLNNNSGATFQEAKLKLLAGDVQRANQPRGGGFGGGRPGAAELAADKGFAEEQFSDYHLYTLGRPASIRNREIKQISLLEGFNVPVTKKLIVDALRFYNNYQPQEEGAIGIGRIKPQIRIEFVNDKASGLGMPLPMGKFKVFQRDKSGSTQMLGEDNIDHTPRDEKLSLVVGQAFDVVVDRKRTKFEWLRRGGPTGWGTREWYEIDVRNRKETAERVYIWERHWWQWAIKENNMPYDKLDASTVQFVVDLKGGETKTLKYMVETYWP